jgi:hypothetical protein
MLKMDRKRQREIVRDVAARRRPFELPGIQELSKEQERVRALPMEGRHLIVGGPGTGKTVVALLRTRRHQKRKDDYQFLVWNQLLHRASRQLHGEELKSATWHGWFKKRFREMTRQFTPCRPAEPSGFEPIDWDGVEHLLASGNPPGGHEPFLVIDEGQDMPPQFYRSLVALGFERFFVAADQNQQIHDEHSGRRDIETELAIDTGDVVELTCNYRNSAPVAKLARAFYTGDPASPPVELPSRQGPAAWLCAYAPERFADLCRRIVKIVDRDPATLVGVIAPGNDVRERYFDGLRAVTRGLDNEPRIHTFFSQHRPEVRFDEGGILVINAQACKGLEFDVAVLADIERHHVTPTDLDAVRKRFYVMVARAREQVILLRQRGGKSRIEEILPADPAVLRRRDLR